VSKHLVQTDKRVHLRKRDLVRIVATSWADKRMCVDPGSQQVPLILGRHVCLERGNTVTRVHTMRSALVVQLIFRAFVPCVVMPRNLLLATPSSRGRDAKNSMIRMLFAFRHVQKTEIALHICAAMARCVRFLRLFFVDVPFRRRRSGCLPG
jgi:hypothetical protein